ncbi:uncharacterized protein LOC112555609 [Pomacea canaliculata]|uniref:uncharacterized protein LOC112555609 n=1 Tax=Pomacea canaliculata TaxID=400727 RepID=UPI000D73595F|nr:uncharacterized protein LOC112555609 [Pomacea canaliculata]
MTSSSNSLEIGDKMYVALQGRVSIYVIGKDAAKDGSRENEAINAEVLDFLNEVCSKKKLDRSALGVLVYSGENATFGEVALVEVDSVRTATVVADNHIDLLTIDRDLFNRCLRGVVAEDMQAKSSFVDRNPAFRAWPPRQRKQLVISLTTEKVSYGARVIRQGQAATHAYFISSGEVEINLEPRQYKSQFPRVWTEMESLIPDLRSSKRALNLTPHEDRIQRLAVHRPQQICILGENEHLGALEMILGLDHYIESACTKSACVLLKLGRPQFDRLMKRKFALPTIENLKENLASRLCLYIYQCPPNDAAFLKYLNMKLADASLMATLRKSKQVFDTNGVFQGAIVDKERSEARTELMKRLHMSADRAASLPPEDMSEVVVANMDKRLKLWSEKSNLNGGKLVRLQTAHEFRGSTPAASNVA